MTEEQPFAKRVASAAKGLSEAIKKDEVPPLLDRQDLKPRVAAAMIDVAIASAVVFMSFLVGTFFRSYLVANLGLMVGAMTATAYMLLRDGIHGSRSPGKALVTLRVEDEEGHLVGLSSSIRRNKAPAAPFAAIVVHALLNLFYDLLRGVATLISGILLLAALGYLTWEVYCLLRDREHSRRPGDHAAGTCVVELDD